MKGAAHEDQYSPSVSHQFGMVVPVSHPPTCIEG
jgi:hypothetical protein